MDESNAKNADLSALKIERNPRKGAPGRHKRWLHLLWLLVPVALYFTYQIAIQKVKPAMKVRTATVQMLTGTSSTAELVATGYVVAQVKAAVASKATGRLRVLKVEEGDSIRAGQVIAELDNDDIQADLDLARANLKSSLADSVAAELNLNRQKKLLESGFTTDEVLESATAQFNRAMAEVEAMRASVRSAEVALENTLIRAPFNGTVLTKHADVGEMVAPFASASSSKGAVVTMADMTSLEVEADVSESNIQKVKVGGPCEIVLDAYPEHTYRGYVKKIVPTADRARATVMTKIAFDHIDAQVLPEMSARVNFLPVVTGKESAEVKPVMVVPNEALTMRDGQQVVFKLVDQAALQTPVTIGRKLGDVTEIISGLSMGDVVILSPPGSLISGDKVEAGI
jgi:RND family efflux transporter MFP subunit